MSTFMMFGKYSSEALKGISAERTKSAADLLEKHGGKIGAMYAMLGEHDLLLIVDLPGAEEAMRVSIALSKLTGVSFTSCPAVTVERFDEMATGA